MVISKKQYDNLPKNLKVYFEENLGGYKNTHPT